jgi:hypothetical protein
MAKQWLPCTVLMTKKSAILCLVLFVHLPLKDTVRNVDLFGYPVFLTK